jgi:flagellar assembly protein FliH
MTPWYEAAAPARRVERDLPQHRLRVVGQALESKASAAPAGWLPELAPEFSEVDRARREGYEAGLRESAQQASDVERKRLHTLATSVGDTARAINAERSAAVNVAENDVLELALQLAEVLVGRELELSSAPWREAVRRALQLAPSETEIRLRLHPEDAVGAQQDDELMQQLSPLVRIVADHGVERSGAIADAGSSRIDAQISSALSRVRAALNLPLEDA